MDCLLRFSAYPCTVKLCFLILKFWIFIWRFQALQHMFFIYTSLGKCWPPASFFLWFLLWFVSVCNSFIYLEFILLYEEYGLHRWLSGVESTCNSGMQIWSLSEEDLLEKEMATHSSILAWDIPWGGVWRSMVCGVAKSQIDLVTKRQWRDTGNWLYYYYYFF